jgi:hypothetical protein
LAKVEAVIRSSGEGFVNNSTPLATSTGKCETIRTIIDFIVNLTEEQAIGAYHRLTGISLGRPCYIGGAEIPMDASSHWIGKYLE